MIPLDQDLKVKKHNLLEFKNITLRVLQYLPAVISSHEEKNDYKLHFSYNTGLKKYLRPLNSNLFIYDAAEFNKCFDQILKFLQQSSPEKNKHFENKDQINKVFYTIQQSIGVGFDLLVDQNSARKHVGNRFEELIRAIFTEMKIANRSTVLKIPYSTDEGEKFYSCENDIIISPHSNVRSTNKHLDPSEIIVGVKTTSKDRMGKMFIDKILLEKFVNHKQKVIAIFLNDVQRKESNNISFTLVSGLFMVYTDFLVKLDGVYYLDPPPNALKEPYNKHMSTFSELLTNDIWELFSA